MKLIFVLSSLAWAQAVTAPQMGMMIDSRDRLHPLFGVSSSVTAGDPVATGVISSACANGFCVWKTALSIASANTETQAPGAALVTIDGASALVYFPETRKLARWQPGSLMPVPFNVDGAIVGLRSVAGSVQLAVRRDGITWIEDVNGSALDSLPASSGPVLLLPDAAIYTDSAQVVLRRSDGSELRFDAPGAQSMHAIEANYVEIRASGVNYALRVDPGRENIFQLPEPAQ